MISIMAEMTHEKGFHSAVMPMRGEVVDMGTPYSEIADLDFAQTLA